MKKLTILIMLLSLITLNCFGQTRPSYYQLKDVKAPFEYGAIGDGVTDDTVAMQAAIDSGYPIEGKDTYLCTGGLTITAAGTYLKLHKLVIGAPVIFVDGANCKFTVDHFSVSDAFTVGGNMLECGASGDTARSYNFRTDIGYVTGMSPDGTVRANVVRNYNCTFGDWKIDRILNAKSVYSCILPNASLGDNTVHGVIMENVDYGMYVWGRDSGGYGHVEHHTLRYAFIAGAQYGAMYLRENAHYGVLDSTCDFNGQGLTYVAMTATSTIALDATVTGSVSGATGKIIAIVDNAFVVEKISVATFTVADSVTGVAVSSVTDYNGDDKVYYDFTSQTVGGFARHTLNCPFLTNIFGNNPEDWNVFSAQGSSNFRARLAGHSFYAASGEQYIQLSAPVWSARYGATKVLESSASTAALRTTGGQDVLTADATTMYLRDGAARVILKWVVGSALEIGNWSGSETINFLRNLIFPTAGYDAPHVIMGGSSGMHIFADTTNGVIRIKKSAPVSDTDGQAFGDGKVYYIGITATPTAAVGTTFFNSTTSHFYGYNGSAWVQLDN